MREGHDRADQLPSRSAWWWVLWASVVLVPVAAFVFCCGGLGWLAWPLLHSEPQPPDLDPGFALERLEAPGDVVAVAFSPDGRYLAAGCAGGPGRRGEGGGEVVLWDVATRRQVAAAQFDMWVTAISFSPDSRRLLVAASYVDVHSQPGPEPRKFEPGEVKLLDVPGLGERAARTFDVPIAWARLSPDGTTAGVVLLPPGNAIKSKRYFMKRGELALLDGQTLKQRHVIGKPSNPASAFAISPDGREVVVASLQNATESNCYLDAFEVKTGRHLRRLGESYAGICAECSPDGREFLTVYGGMTIFDLTTGKAREPNSEQPPGEGGGAWMRSVCYSPDGKFLLEVETVKHSSRNPRSRAVLIGRGETPTRRVLYTGPRRAGFTCGACAPGGRLYAVGTAPYRDTLESPYKARVLLLSAIGP